jgi:hypothetical protein
LSIRADDTSLTGALVEEGKLDWSTTIEQVFPENAKTLPSVVRCRFVLDM